MRGMVVLEFFEEEEEAEEEASPASFSFTCYRRTSVSL